MKCRYHIWLFFSDYLYVKIRIHFLPSSSFIYDRSFFFFVIISYFVVDVDVCFGIIILKDEKISNWGKFLVVI